MEVVFRIFVSHVVPDLTRPLIVCTTSFPTRTSIVSIFPSTEQLLVEVSSLYAISLVVILDMSAIYYDRRQELRARRFSFEAYELATRLRLNHFSAEVKI